MDPDVSSAVSMSNLRGLPGEVLDELMTGAVRTKIPAGSLMHRGGELIVPVTQQEPADAVGTVREVIVRVLRELRREGVVRTERDRMVILDPALLIDEQGWNPCS